MMDGVSWSVGEGFCFANFNVELSILYFYLGRTVELGRYRGEQDCQFLTGIACEERHELATKLKRLQ